ncbi:unnamed protein product [Lampetra planeri]
MLWRASGAPHTQAEKRSNEEASEMKYGDQVEGLYPENPDGSELDFSALKEEICKFLVSLSKDFSSYYNRFHVLGEPLPHLFNQMFLPFASAENVERALPQRSGHPQPPPHQATIVRT